MKPFKIIIAILLFLIPLSAFGGRYNNVTIIDDVTGIRQYFPNVYVTDYVVNDSIVIVTFIDCYNRQYTLSGAAIIVETVYDNAQIIRYVMRPRLYAHRHHYGHIPPPPPHHHHAQNHHTYSTHPQHNSNGAPHHGGSHNVQHNNNRTAPSYHGGNHASHGGSMSRTVPHSQSHGSFRGGGSHHPSSSARRR